MSAWLAWARNALIAWVALTLFAGAITQLLAAIFGYDPRFGEPIAFWYGHPLYDPWLFLHWGVEFAPSRPLIAFLCLSVALVVVLAAFAVLALTGLIAPFALPGFKSRHGFADWDILGQRGLLAANGLALGAVRRHPFAKPELVSAPVGNLTFVGAPEHTDAALLATIASWPGALVFVDGRGLASRLPRQSVLRFAPGRTDSAAYNPMLAIRGGAYAWADACLLAEALLRSDNNALIEVFAALMLDQLLAAPLEARHLAALRARLADPHRLLADICAAWGEHAYSAPAPQAEIARAVRSWRRNATLDHLAAIDEALEVFADGAIAQATFAHQFRFADLVAGDGADTLLIAMPPDAAARAAPLIRAMLAQLAAECAAQADVDCFGRPKQRELLLVIEAEALQALTREGLLPPTHAAANGCRLLLQTPSMEWVPAGAIAAIAAIGPQTEASSAELSRRAGTVTCWRRMQAGTPGWRDWVFPVWERIERPIVPPSGLRNADPSAALLLLKGLGPIMARALSADAAQTGFADGATLEPIAHDWSAPAMSCPQAPSTEVSSVAPAPPIGAKIRSALTRRAPPRSRPKAHNP